MFQWLPLWKPNSFLEPLKASITHHWKFLKQTKEQKQKPCGGYQEAKISFSGESPIMNTPFLGLSYQVSVVASPTYQTMFLVLQYHCHYPRCHYAFRCQPKTGHNESILHLHLGYRYFFSHDVAWQKRVKISYLKLLHFFPRKLVIFLFMWNMTVQISLKTILDHLKDDWNIHRTSREKFLNKSLN